MPVERPQLCGPELPSLRVGSIESRLVPPADVHDADEYRQGNFSSHASRRQLRRITRSPLSAGLMRRRRRHKRWVTNSFCSKNDMHVSHVHSTPCPLPCLPSSPRGLASNEKYRFIFNKALSVNTDSVLDQERREFSKAEPVLPVEIVNQPKTAALENEPLDPGKLQQSQANLSLRHRLVLAQPRLKKGHRLRPPVPLVGPEMDAFSL